MSEEQLRDALVLAKTALEQGFSLDARPVSNGPTLRAIIDAALAGGDVVPPAEDDGLLMVGFIESIRARARERWQSSTGG